MTDQPMCKPFRHAWGPWILLKTTLHNADTMSNAFLSNLFVKTCTSCGMKRSKVRS